jgi:hypothetical protein
LSGVGLRTQSTIDATMRRSLVERSLSDVHGRLRKAREELAVMDEQMVVINDIADDLRLRSLVSETPLAVHEHSDAQRHLEAAQRARIALIETIAELERKQDELLERLTF